MIAEIPPLRRGIELLVDVTIETESLSTNIPSELQVLVPFDERFQTT
jgi:hypothetical protein